MVSRLVVGCGSVGRTLAMVVREWRGDLLVLTGDDHRVESLRNEGIAAKRADITDSSALRANATAPDTVIIGGDKTTRNAEATVAARDAFPEAFLLAYAGENHSTSDRETIRQLADRVVDAGETVANAALETIGDDGVRPRRLLAILRTLEGPLGVFTHDNPDPDAIASAVALKRVAQSVGCEAEVCYYGEISHHENRALVNLLEFDLRNVTPGDPLEYGGYALVDHSRPGMNNQLPPDTPIDVVVDHHPPRGPVEARFVDLRSGVGATSTLMTDYLRRLDMAPESFVATGLLFGIFVDTDDFTRGVSPDDFHAAAYLLPHADVGTLERIESPSISAETLETVAMAIRNKEINNGVLTSCVGETNDRDALALAADRLLNMDGITTTLVFGYSGTTSDDTVFISSRARRKGPEPDLGEALRDAFGQIGSAGGHADMAGAQIPVRSLSQAFADDDPADSGTVIKEVITDRFFEALDVGRIRSMPTVFSDDGYLGLLQDTPSRGGNWDGGANEETDRQSRNDGGRHSTDRDGGDESSPLQ